MVSSRMVTTWGLSPRSRVAMGSHQTRLHPLAQLKTKMVLCQALPLVLVGLLASFASGEETTIASTSAEPFWLGKDCVRNEDGEWRLRSRFAYISLKNSTSVFKILNSLKMLPRHEKKVPHESLLYLEQIALSKVHFSGTVRDAAGEEDPNTVVSRKPFYFLFWVALDWVSDFGFSGVLLQRRGVLLHKEFEACLLRGNTLNWNNWQKTIVPESNNSFFTK